MSTVTVHKRPTIARRRADHVVAIGVNVILYYLINRSPGWAAVPFLTSATTEVLGWVNATLVAGFVANALYVVWDPRWFKALGDIVTTSIGLLSMLRIWQVFPFDFGASGFDWPLVARIALGLGIGGSIIAIVVAVVTVLRVLALRE